MSYPRRFFLVLTDMACGSRGTGYRGVWRATPRCHLFAKDDLPSVERLQSAFEEDEESRLPTLKDAIAYRSAALDQFGIESEIIECRVVSSAGEAEDARSVDGFLGFDVAIAKGGFSAIYYLCGPLWHRGGSLPEGEIKAVSKKLNSARLFDNYADATNYERLACRLDEECPNHDLHVIAVLAPGA